MGGNECLIKRKKKKNYQMGVDEEDSIFPNFFLLGWIEFIKFSKKKKLNI